MVLLHEHIVERREQVNNHLAGMWVFPKINGPFGGVANNKDCVYRGRN